MSKEQLLNINKVDFHFSLFRCEGEKLGKDIFILEVRNEKLKIKKEIQIANYDMNSGQAFVHNLIEILVFTPSFVSKFKKLEDKTHSKNLGNKISWTWPKIHKRIQNLINKVDISDQDLLRFKLVQADIYSYADDRAIIEAAKIEDLAEINKFTQEIDVAIKVLKWRYRGMPLNMAIRKIKLDVEREKARERKKQNKKERSERLKIRAVKREEKRKKNLNQE